MSEIQELLLKKMTWTQICKIVKCSRRTVANHARKLRLNEPFLRKKFEELNWEKIKEYLESHSLKEAMKQFNFSMMIWRKALEIGLVKSKQKRVTLEEIMVSNSVYPRRTLKRKILKEKLIPYICGICNLRVCCHYTRVTRATYGIKPFHSLI